MLQLSITGAFVIGPGKMSVKNKNKKERNL